MVLLEKYKLLKVISADTVSDLLQNLENIDNITSVIHLNCENAKEIGIGVAVENFTMVKKLFTDAFDHTKFNMDVYEISDKSFEKCLLISDNTENLTKITNVAQLKNVLCSLQAQTIIVSPDNDFELHGCITKGVSFLLYKIQNSSQFVLQIDSN